MIQLFSLFNHKLLAERENHLTAIKICPLIFWGLFFVPSERQGLASSSLRLPPSLSVSWRHSALLHSRTHQSHTQNREPSSPRRIHRFTTKGTKTAPCCISSCGSKLGRVGRVMSLGLSTQTGPLRPSRPSYPFFSRSCSRPSSWSLLASSKALHRYSFNLSHSVLFLSCYLTFVVFALWVFSFCHPFIYS
jgi:hypothetical protein